MVPAYFFQKTNAPLFNIGSAIFIYKPATIVGRIDAKTRIDFGF